MKRCCMILCLFVLTLGVTFPSSASAARYVLENAYHFPINVALTVPVRGGWAVRGWYRVEAYSRRSININNAIPGRGFAFHAKTLAGPPISWGKSVRICVGSQPMNHWATNCPRYGNTYYRNFSTKNGNFVRFTR